MTSEQLEPGPHECEVGALATSGAHPGEPPLDALHAEIMCLRERLAVLTAQAQRLEGSGKGAESGTIARRIRPLGKIEALLEESQRLAKIGSFELDVATRQLTWSDQQFRNFGFSPVPVIDRAIVVRRIDPRDMEHHEASVKRAIEEGEAFAINYRVTLPDGQVRHLHTIGQPVMDDEGRVVKLVGTSQDVTERTLLEEQLRSQNEQLRQLDRLKNNIIDSVTHELRTPLTTIMGFTEFLADRIGGPVTHEQQEFITQIQRGAQRLESLLNDLLDFARLEAGTFMLKPIPADLGGLVSAALECLRPQADETGLTLAVSLDGPLEFDMDPQRIGQVVTNLVANAIKFSPPGGTVRISAGRQGERIRCEVADKGAGIAPEEMPRLFQRFSQLEAGVQMGKGAGLGLSISKALVEAHGGTIGVESTRGVGSTFWFELPVRSSEDAL